MVDTQLDDTPSRTYWTDVKAAHGPDPDEARAAMQRLVDRYHAPVRRYLGRLTHSPHDADELAQQFALHLLGGKLRHADPRRGRFRDYVKATLVNLTRDHYARQRRAAQTNLAVPEVAPAPLVDLDWLLFDRDWREGLLVRVLASLGRDHPVCHAVLCTHAEHPRLSSDALAGMVGRRLGRVMTAGGYRQALRRARTRFAELLYREVAGSLGDPTPQAVEDELRDLRLLKYCQPYLRRGGRNL